MTECARCCLSLDPLIATREATEKLPHAHLTSSFSTRCCYWEFQMWQIKMFNMSAAYHGKRNFQKWQNQTQNDLRFLLHSVPSLLWHLQPLPIHRENNKTTTKKVWGPGFTNTGPIILSAQAQALKSPGISTYRTTHLPKRNVMQ